MRTIEFYYTACKQVLVISLLSIISCTVNAQVCTSTKDYETGLKNGLKMAPPCELINTSKLPKCSGEYNVASWSTCYGERTSTNGGTYRGGYFEGKAHGKGEFVNPDGTRYLGDYLKGQRNGYGKEYSANGIVLREGQWNAGLFAEAADEVRLLLSTTNAQNISRSLAQCSGQWFYVVGSIKSGTIKFPDTDAALKGYAIEATDALEMANKISGSDSKKISEDFFNRLKAKHQGLIKEYGKTELGGKYAFELAMNGSKQCADYVQNKDVVALIRNQR
jgi:hypothetical protein